MKNLINEALAQIKASNGATRLVVAAGVALVLAVGVFSIWRGRNPHMIFFQGGLDNGQFSSVTSALGQKGIRFRTSTTNAPYTVFVDEEKYYEAYMAIAQDGALLQGTRGIDPGSGTSAFDASVERLQKAAKRDWQEVEQLLEAMDWIAAARVIANSSRNAIYGRHNQATVSVQLRTRLQVPGPNRSQAAASLVSNALSTDPKNISIVDQHGELLFDGSRDNSLDGVLAFNRNADQERTQLAQDLLDKTYGPGMGVVTVHTEWNYDMTESVDEALDPKKAVLTESISDSSTPGITSAGGPAGVQENLTVAQPGASGNGPATRNDTERQYGYGSKTTHKIQNQPQLTRITASLILDVSLQEELEEANKLVRNAVGINEERGDQFTGHAFALHGIERDEEGNPIPAAPVAPLEAPNRLLELVLKHSIEGIAALAFFIVLVRSLKGGDKALRENAAANRKQSKAAAARQSAGIEERGAEDEEIEIDPEVLARRQIEQLIDTDPERVSALLSRWAMGDAYYSEAEA